MKDQIDQDEIKYAAVQIQNPAISQSKSDLRRPKTLALLTPNHSQASTRAAPPDRRAASGTRWPYASNRGCNNFIITFPACAPHCKIIIAGQ